MNSVLYLTERLRQRAHLAPLTREQHDMSDALAVLVSAQLGLANLLELEPDNGALKMLKRWLDREMVKLDANLRNVTIDEQGEQA